MSLSTSGLRELLGYFPSAGDFVWLTRTSNNVIGSQAGALRSDGYLSIGVDGKSYLAHRLAWFWIYAEWPTSEIDHINMDKCDNRIINLREATSSENKWNRGMPRTNTSGFKGVSWNKKKGKWQAQIKQYDKYKYLGLFDSPEEGYSAYCREAETLFGAFARTA